MMKNALITGSNRGIGFEIARQMGEKGFRVFISGRNESLVNESLNKLRSEGIQAEILIMDVNNPESVKSAADSFGQLNIKLDVLINNAAILLKEDNDLATDPPEILERTIQTNGFGVMRVIHAFLPFINNPGRIVNISSDGGSMTDEIGGWSPAYCVSKTMLNGITRQLANALARDQISVNAVNPGWVNTRMGGSEAPRPVAKGAETPVWLASEAPHAITGKFFMDKKEIPW